MAEGPAPLTRPGPAAVAEPLAGRGLAAFVAAVESGTVQGAADALSLTQSAATKRIQALERRVGSLLLHRGRAGVSPTSAGRRLYPEARRALDALIAAERVVSNEESTAVLRVAASHTVGAFFLPTWLARFRAEAPGIRPRVDVVNSPGVLHQLRAGTIDIGFVEGDDPLEGLESLVVAADEIVVAVSAQHRWAPQSALKADRLQHEPYVTREAGSRTRAVAEGRLHRVGVTLIPDVEFASLEGVKRALTGGGFTLISRRAIEAEIRLKALTALPVQGVDMRRHLFAARAERARRNPQEQAFWRFLAEWTRPVGSAAPA